MTHPDFITLSEWSDGALDELHTQRVAAHLIECERCTREVSLMKAAQTQIVQNREVIRADFTDSVMQRVLKESRRRSAISFYLVPACIVVALVACALWVFSAGTTNVSSDVEGYSHWLSTSLRITHKILFDRTTLILMTLFVAFSVILFIDYLYNLRRATFINRSTH